MAISRNLGFYAKRSIRRPAIEVARSADACYLRGFPGGN